MYNIFAHLVAKFKASLVFITKAGSELKKEQKNSWHDRNDIVLAIIIIIIAAGVILWRFSIIMNYPEKLAADNAMRASAEQKKEKTADVESADISDIKTGSAFKNGHLQHKISVTIGDTKDSAAVQELIDKKLFADYDQFLEGLKTTGGSMDQVQPGTINFNKGASAEDVLKALVTTA